MSLLHLKQNEIESLTEEVINDFKISAKTAIGRTKVSAPLQIIINNGLFGNSGSVLHYGKGRTTLDSQVIKDLGLNVVDYDFVYCPKPEVLGRNYDFVVSLYVVNTLPRVARTHVYQQLAEVCSKGVVFIAARSDVIKGVIEDDGLRTSKNTFQKSYSKKNQELLKEAQQFFRFVEEIKGKPGMSIIRCSNYINFKGNNVEPINQCLF